MKKKKEVDGDKYGFFLEDFMKYYVIHANKKKAKKNEFDCQLYPKINTHNIELIEGYKKIIKKNVNEYVSMFISYIICGVASNGTVSDEVIIAAFLNGLEIIKRKLECEKNNITLTEKEMMKFKLSEKTLEEKIRELNLLSQEGDFVLDCTNKEKSELKEYVPLYDYHLVYYFRSNVNQKELKKNLQEAREMELEELKEQIIKPRNGEYDSGGANLDYIDINYKLVEEASPNYTMKGRYNHGSIFDMPDNYSLINNEDDDEENKIGSNGKPIQDEEYKKSLPVPQYNAVKPALPTYSFSKAARFYSKPLYQPSPNAVPVMPFKDGKFKPDDVKSFFNGRGGLYKAKKDNVLKENGIPGPGQYRIKGFAEILAEKGKKISDIRDNIKQKEKEMEMRKREEEKNLENLNKIGGGENIGLL